MLNIGIDNLTKLIRNCCFCVPRGCISIDGEKPNEKQIIIATIYELLTELDIDFNEEVIYDYYRRAKE